MAPSEPIEAAIREKAKRLDRFYDRIMGCRVVVEAPHRSHRKGKVYHVRIDLTVPGSELLVKRDPPMHGAHEDIYVAVRDAFNAAGRKLQDYARRQRGVMKSHELEPMARVVRLFPEEGFGFLETADGREIYFHRNSVLDPGFDSVEVGTKVYFAEEEGAKGPQATTVKLAGKHLLR